MMGVQKALVDPEAPVAERGPTWDKGVLGFQSLGAERVEAAGKEQPPVVILPGFGNNTEDYTAPFGQSDSSLVAALQARGFRPFVVDLERKSWIKVARSLLSWRFYNKTCTTSPGYTWYLDLVAAKVEQAREETGCSQVDLIGHSAGGWLARAFIANPSYHEGDSKANPTVRRLVTLGAPHVPPPDPSKDMTGGALGWVHKQYPGAWLEENEVACLCVAGRTVRGNPDAEKGTLARYACGSYAMVCGEGAGVEGDAVVPLPSAFVEGVDAQTLPGVFHSMSKVGTYGEASKRPWYGSDEVVDSWLSFLVE